VREEAKAVNVPARRINLKSVDRLAMSPQADKGFLVVLMRITAEDRLEPAPGWGQEEGDDVGVGRQGSARLLKSGSQLIDVSDDQS
jgi:hypothetical protein